MPPAFGTGICKVHSDTRGLSPILTRLGDSVQSSPPDVTKARQTATDLKAEVSSIQAEMDQLPPWAGDDVVVKRFGETMDQFQDSMNLFLTGTNPLTLSIVQQASVSAASALDKLKLAVAALDAIRATSSLPC
jgi:hypothetical protein